MNILPRGVKSVLFYIFQFKYDLLLTCMSAPIIHQTSIDINNFQVIKKQTG